MKSPKSLPNSGRMKHGMFFSSNTKAIVKTLSPFLHEIEGFSEQDWGQQSSNLAVTDNDEDFALFELDLPSVYYGHLFCSTRTGSESISFGKEALSFLFNNSEAKVVYGLTPYEKKHVRLIMRKIGLKSYGAVNTEKGLMENFIITEKEWRTKNE
jgi:hypothetical protein